MTKIMTATLLVLSLMFVGCDNDTDTVLVEEDVVPATPQGVFSVTGDGTVYVLWNGIYDRDVDYYTVYRSLQATTGYVAIANVDAVPNPDLDLLIYEYPDNGAVNGVTYWYALTAVDHAGQESELSAENVFDTPRPEGSGVTLLPFDLAPGAAGFNLAAHQVVTWDSPVADIFVDRTYQVDGTDTTWIPYLNAGLFTAERTDIQDLGYTENFDEISYAPVDGWSWLGYAEAIEGHTYVIWTGDDHYAKVRVTSITTSGAIAFQWAYQTAPSNLELAPPVRPDRDRENPQPKSVVTTQLLK